jgi:hypothetical protein
VLLEPPAHISASHRTFSLAAMGVRPRPVKDPAKGRPEAALSGDQMLDWPFR